MHRSKLRVVFTVLMLTVFAAAAAAQSERRMGVVIAYPGSVGVEWQAAPRVAVRFDGDFTQVNNAATSSFDLSFLDPSFELTTEIEARNIEFGVSVLYDLHRSDELRVYIAPRLGVNLSRTSYETEFDGDPAILAFLTVPADSESTSTSPAGGISLGASHDLSPRFRVFGEAGFHYLRGNFGGAIGADIEGSTFGLRAGVGAVILF